MRLNVLIFTDPANFLLISRVRKSQNAKGEPFLRLEGADGGRN